MEKSSGAGLLFIPGEIIIDILSRLPVDSVLQCKRVCKTWRSLIDHDPTFLAMHTHRFMIYGDQTLIKSVSSFCFILFVNKYECWSELLSYRLHFGEYHDNNGNGNNKSNISVKLSGKPTLEKEDNIDDIKCIISCNGLILIALSPVCRRHGNNMMVLNPVTKEYVDLPPSGEEEEEFDPLGTISTGFGYHPITKEYKIVRIKYPKNYTRDQDHGYIIYVYIYTLGRSSWSKRREIEVEYNFHNPNYASHSHGFGCSGVLLNGVLHWIGEDGVLSFDLADEEFKILPLPPPQPPEAEEAGRQNLGVLGGCLCVIRKINVVATDIWVLSSMNKEEIAAGKEEEEEENSSCSWTKKLSIPIGECIFLSTLESGKILLLLRFYVERLHFVTYDPKTGNCGYYVHNEEDKSINLDYPLNRLVDIIPYVKSFVSLKALGEEDAKYISC